MSKVFADSAIPDRWPIDYVSMEAGKLLVRADYVDRFRARGWNVARDILADQTIAIFRRVAGRENGLIDWDDSQAARCYLKRHHPVRTDEHENNVPGWHEATATGWCQEAGVGTASVVAAGHDEPYGSFFMSEELTGFLPADEWARKHLAGGVDGSRRDRFLGALAKQARTFHEAGLSHRDFYWCHHFVRETESGSFDTRLIDLQRVHRPRWRGWRWRLKDLGQFFASAPDGFFSSSERAQWLKEYAGVTRLRGKERAWLLAIETRAGLYKWREKSA